jgi:hypothetical protein
VPTLEVARAELETLRVDLLQFDPWLQNPERAIDVRQVGPQLRQATQQ